jgi:uncharacterized membrane protein
MKISWRTEVASWAILAGMFVLAAVSWNQAPDSIPIHWNITGTADGFAGKAEGLLLYPVASLGLYLALLLIPRFDPKRSNDAAFSGTYKVLRLIMLAFFAVVYGIVHLWIRGYEISMSTFMPIAIGMLFIVLGNFMGKIRPTWFVGIRTPWTLSNSTVWTRTHRLGGWLFIGTGFLTVLSALIVNRWAFYVVIAATAASAVTAVIYSYAVWRELKMKEERRM